MVSATASKDKNGVIHISLSNVNADETQEITINLGDTKAKKATGEILTSAKLTDYNSFENPNIVKPAPFKEVKINKGTMKAVSYTHLDVYKRQPVSHPTVMKIFQVM